MSSWSKTKAIWKGIQDLDKYSKDCESPKFKTSKLNVLRLNRGIVKSLKEYESPKFKTNKLKVLRLNREIVRNYIKSDDVKVGSIKFNKASKVIKWIEKEIRIEEMQL